MVLISNLVLATRTEGELPSSTISEQLIEIYQPPQGKPTNLFYFLDYSNSTYVGLASNISSLPFDCRSKL